MKQLAVVLAIILLATPLLGTTAARAEIEQGIASLFDLTQPPPGPQKMRLNQDRFEVEVEWRDFGGKTGTGHVVNVASDDSGLFWFFGADNWEMLVKVLDGCAINDRYWVFAAATTNVEYTLTVNDTLTGEVKEYFNPLGIAPPALTDTSAFATCSSKSRRAPAPTVDAATSTQTVPQKMRLNQDRFEVEVEWRDFGGKTGTGHVVNVASDDSGLFWFFGADNWEMLVKVLDGCGINDRYWVFAAATTNVEYTLTVNDTLTGEVKEYFNPLGIAPPALTDTSAFATCSSTPPNHPPTASTIVMAVKPDAVFTIYFSEYISDIDGDPVTLVGIENPPVGLVLMGIDYAAGTAQFRAALEPRTVDAFTYAVSDGEAIVEGIIEVTITSVPDIDGDGVPDDADLCPSEPGPASNQGCPVDPCANNTPPTAYDLVPFVSPNGSIDISISEAGVDDDGHSIFFTGWSNGPFVGVVEILDGGTTLRYRNTDNGQNSADFFKFTIEDECGGTDTGAVSVNVQ